MEQERFLQASVLLNDGRVLISGGTVDFRNGMPSCEIYDYRSNSVVPAAAMNVARFEHSAVLLDNGMVLVAGGVTANDGSLHTDNITVAECELYDPAFDTWIPTGSLHYPRERFPMLKLPNGKVLITGGIGGNGGWHSTTGCEIYDPATGQWTEEKPIWGKERNSHEMVLLPNGSVLVPNGYSHRGGLTPVCQLYNPSANTWNRTGSLRGGGNGDYNLTLLDNGKVLYAGGWPGPQLNAELYDSESGEWVQTAPMQQRRAKAVDVKLADGSVLLSGGVDALEAGNDRSLVTLASCERYLPASGQWETLEDLPIDVWQHSAHLLPNDQVLIIGGCKYGSSRQVLDVYDNIIVSNFATQFNGGTISGRIWRDENMDCVNEPTESGVHGAMVRITPGPIFAYADENGDFEALVHPGTYTVHPVQRDFWRVDCPRPPLYHVSIGNPGEVAAGNDFGLIPLRDVQVLDISIVSGQARPGFPLDYTIRYENVGTLPFSGTLSLVYDALLEYLGSTPTEDRHTPPLLEWDLFKLPVGGKGLIIASFRVPPRAELIGRELCARVFSDKENRGDDIARYDRDEHCQEIRGSYDPNDIRVFPRGIGPQGKLASLDTELSYVVRFQNTGNAEALKVVVIDTLSPHHDITTLRLGAASHDFDFHILYDRILVWTFDKIDLPYKAADEQGSQGYLKFKIRLKPDLPLGTAVENRAAIYFDFNEPIITNTVVSTYDSEVTAVSEADETGLRFYPNPARDVLYIEAAALPDAATVSISDAHGRLVLGSVELQSGQLRLDLSSLAAGTYLLEVHQGQGRTVKKLYILR